MKSLSKWFMLLMLISTLALVGCEGDDGDDGAPGPAGPAGPEGPAGPAGPGFELPDGEYVGLSNCAACHGGSGIGDAYSESAHLNQGDHTMNSCAVACHNPLGDNLEAMAAFGVDSPSVVGCESCHGLGSGHFGVGEIPVPSPDSAVCGQCHDAEGELAHLTHHPFNELIYSRFELSGHGEAHAREAFCSSCHSHEGALQFLSMGGAADVLDLDAKYNEETVSTWSLTEEELSLKQCSTCHDPHTLEVRGEDTVELLEYVDGDDEYEEETVVFSAEFNLCTTCHQVALDYEPAGHGDAGILLEYTLSSDSYSAANMVDAATGTFEEVTFEIANADGSLRDRTVYATQVFYHDNTPGGGRSFIDTHFAGTVVGRLAAVDETTDPSAAVTDVEVVGYNINAANPDACTVCHDPHSANKVQGEDLDVAVAAAEGVGMFHANYLGDAQGHGCQPCHNGQESFVTWVVGGSMPDERVTDVVACRTCHVLESVGVDGEGNEILGDPTEVREFAAGHEFVFESGVVADVADLGINQICFECHKGRTPAPTAAEEAALVEGPGQIRTFGYLHYAPSMAILYGDDSKMVTTYAGKSYNGKFMHPFAINGVQAFGCVDCHDVHDTNGNMAETNKMTTSPECSGCHASGSTSADALRDRSVAFGEALLETLLDVCLVTPGLEDDLQADLDAAADRAEQLEVMDLWTHGRTNELPTLALQKAAEVYKVFNYEDGSPHGTTHGHGGSWAHNSKFARQVQYDAIEDLGGDLTGLTRP